MLAEAYIYFGVALAGLVSFLSPCVLPLVPPYLGYLGGTTISQSSVDDGIDDAVWRRVVFGSMFFVLGFTTVFVGLGAGASMFGQLLHSYQQELSIAAGLVIILFGLHFIGVLNVPLLHSQARYQTNVQGASFAGSYVIGLAFAFGWTPCIGPILAAVLTLAASEASLGRGVQLLFVYSLGLGIPFVLAAVAIGPFMRFMQRFKRHLGTMETAMGVMLLITGLLFAGAALEWVRQAMVSVVPFLDDVRSWLGLALLVGGLCLVLSNRVAHSKVTGVAVIVVAMMLIGGSMTWIGQFMIETFPELARIEEMAAPKDLSADIMKRQ